MFNYNYGKPHYILRCSSCQAGKIPVFLFLDWGKSTMRESSFTPSYCQDGKCAHRQYIFHEIFLFAPLVGMNTVLLRIVKYHP